MRIFLRYIISALIIAMPLTSISAQSGTSAVDFLRIGVSARNAATGGAYSAVSEGPFAAYYNPAGLALTDNIQLAGMHAEWLMDLRYEYLGAAFPVGEKTGLGVSFSYLSLGNIEGFSDVNIPTGNIKAYDMASVVSLGHEFSQKFAAGVGVKGIVEKLDNVQAFGFGFDIGAQYRFTNVTTGISLMNIGPKMKYDNSSFALPTTANLGVAYYPFAYNAAILAGAEIPFSGNPNFKFGLEYNVSRAFSVRSGYDTQDRADNQNGLSFGAGMAIGNGNIDYAYNINNTLGGAHQISFSWGFGGGDVDESYIQNQSAIVKPVVVASPIKVEEKAVMKAEPDTIAAIKADTLITNDSAAVVMASDTITAATVTPGGNTVVAAPIMAAIENPKIDKKKQAYLIIAGRHSDRASAERHAKALEKFGYSPKISEDGQGNFRVVMAEAGGKAKAEKIKHNYDKNGVSCFVEQK